MCMCVYGHVSSAQQLRLVHNNLCVRPVLWSTVLCDRAQLHEMIPDFRRAEWPRVDLIICHYGEPADETLETLKKALAQEYEPSKLHIYIVDDGYYKSEYGVESAMHWPRATLNRRLIASTGDVRRTLRRFFDLLTAENEGRSSDSSHDSNHGTNTAAANAPTSSFTSRTVLPDPKSPERAVPRTDCGVGFVEDRYELPNLPVVSYVARLKPAVHHAKAGNINNALFNVMRPGESGSYVAIFDNDMQPHPQFCISTLPLFFEPIGRNGHASTGSDEAGGQYTDAPELNPTAFVQTPQYFRPSELMTARGGDPLSSENGRLYNVSMPAMDSYESTMFVVCAVTPALHTLTAPAPTSLPCPLPTLLFQLNPISTALALHTPRSTQPLSYQAPTNKLDSSPGHECHVAARGTRLDRRDPIRLDHGRQVDGPPCARGWMDIFLPTQGLHQ